jgi:autotransporter-associated beta strand protein
MKSKQNIRLLAAAALLLGASQTHAAPITWADSAGNTTWTTDSAANSKPASASWVGGFAPTNSTTTDTAIFTSVSNAQPTLTVQTRIAGVEFQMANGGLAMSGGGGSGNVFSIGAGGIKADEQISGTNTITNARMGLLSGNQAWTFFSDVDTASTSTFTFNSTVDLGSRNLTVTGQRNSAAGNVGIINFDRAIAGTTGNLTIDSANANNTVNLNAANTYTGATNVSGGTLLVNGSLASGSAVTVGVNGILGGSGTIGGATIINGSLRPGNSIDTLTVTNDVTWNSGEDWVFELGSGGTVLAPGDSDRLSLTGAGNDFLKGSGAPGSFVFDFAGTGSVGWYKLVSWESTTASGFAPGDFFATNLTSGLSATFTVTDTIGSQGIYLSVIPEPSTWALLGIGLATLAVFRRRRA